MRKSRLVLLVASLLASPAAAEERYVLIVAGLGGESKYSDAFQEWALAFRAAAEKRLGIPAANITCLSEGPERDRTQIDGRSTRDEVETALGRIAQRVRPGEVVFVLLIGHGSYQASESRFNLPGPDLTTADLRRLLAPLAMQKLVVVLAMSASGDFGKALAGPNRVIVTATKSGLERNQSEFGQYFVEAYAKDGADADKNGRVSVFEAFEYARRQVATSYEKGNRLLTEHAQLEDGASGAVARALFLAAGAESSAPEATVTDDPQLAALNKERRDLEDSVEALKARKGDMKSEAYQEELEKLLLELALKNEAIRNTAKAAK